jgi:hypothetical protein
MLFDREREISTHGGRLTAAARLSDQELLGRVARLAGDEREATVELVAHLAELDARRLYLGEGFGSLFTYCTGALRLAEHAAYNRIEAARASRRFPSILGLLANGALNLSTVRLLAPHLQTGNFESLVALAKGRSKREVEVLVARLAPRPDVAASVRKVPAPTPLVAAPGAAVQADNAPAAALAGQVPALTRPVSTLGSETLAIPPAALVADRAGTAESRAPERAASRPVVAPLAPGRYRVQFTVGEATHRRLRQAQQLLRREIPDGDPGAIFDRALALLLEDVVRKKLAATARPRKGSPEQGGARGSKARLGDDVSPAIGTRSRHIPAAVRRVVWRRDRGRCAFTAWNGRRCAERTFLEFHHREPYAIGGEATVANMALRCRAHNAHEADLAFAPGGLAPGRVEPILSLRDAPPGPGPGGVSPLPPP